MAFFTRCRCTITRDLQIPASLVNLLIFLLFYQPMMAADETALPALQVGDSVYTLDHRDFKMGERLFYGLLREQEGQATCVSCHTIIPDGAFNWNPSAYDIAASSINKSTDDLKAVLLTPTGKRIMVAHTGYANLTTEQLVQLKAFLIEYYEQGGYMNKPVVNQLLFFIGLVILLIITFLDLIWFRLIKFRLIHVTVLLAASVLITRIIVIEAIALGRSQNFDPDQPVKFSHTVHAGQNKIDCLYCHSTAESSKTAGIPSVNVCLNCHMVVRDGTRSGRFEINKIFASMDHGQPIKWIRVYNLPDHAFFSHAQHVGAGKIACQTCHGMVEQMDRMVQVPDLSMGWCINCHRDTKVQFHDNQFYASYKELKVKLQKSEIDSVTVAMVGGTDCMKCHY
jgi:hypothetical protein